MPRFDECLQDLNARLDDAQEQAKRDEWVRFLNDQWAEDMFVPSFRTPVPSKVEWPEIHINDACEDIDLMVLSEMKGCSDTLTNGGNSVLCVRCNYGTGIMPLLFGCEWFVMPRDTCTLPTAAPFHSNEKIRAVVDAGVPDARTGIGGRVFDTAQRFLEIFDEYPAIARNLYLYHPDVQGPLDIAEMVWGNEMFYAFHDDPELMHELLALITESYVVFMREWFRLAPPTPECAPHWSIMHKGTLMLRNDSLMNLSSKMYVDFVRPFDQQLFDQFGGGAIHFCGRGDHYIEAMSETHGLTAVNMSQPELNDMETIYCNTVDKGIKLIGLERDAAEKAKRPLRGQAQCY